MTTIDFALARPNTYHAIRDGRNVGYVEYHGTSRAWKWHTYGWRPGMFPQGEAAWVRGHGSEARLAKAKAAVGACWA